MMNDPALAIKTEVHRLVEVQIATLGKPSSLTSSELDEYHVRSEKIADLYQELDTIVRRRFNDIHPRTIWMRSGGPGRLLRSA